MISVSQIANFLETEYIGSDKKVSKVVSIDQLEENAISFIVNNSFVDNKNISGVVIVSEKYDVEEEVTNTYILSKNPKYDFIRVFDRFFKLDKKGGISSSARIDPTVKLGNDVSIGENCVIKEGVCIGDGTIINNNVVIDSNTVIGDGCYIKSGAVIGEEGFSFVNQVGCDSLRFPHIGNVKIFSNVEIGANTVIARAALNSTLIKDNVKIDDQVFVAHNVCIGENTVVIACSEVSGSAVIGKNCWIGPNTTIRDGVKIGDNVFLGMGSIVSRDLADNSKIMSLSDLTFRNVANINRLVNKKR